MKHLVIKNFGPIRNADLQLGQVNPTFPHQYITRLCFLVPGHP